MDFSTKYFAEDIRHYRSMIEADNELLTVLRIKYTQTASESLRGRILEAAESCKDNIDYYTEKIHNLIERGNENG